MGDISMNKNCFDTKYLTMDKYGGKKGFKFVTSEHYDIIFHHT